MTVPRDASRLRLRPAEPGDVLLVYDWATDPETMRMRISKDPITLPQHKRWFADVLAADDVHLFIAEVGANRPRPVGQARLDGAHEIHVGIAPEWRGQGLAAPLIRAATEIAHDELGMQTVVAHVLAQNAPSRRAFESAGYAFVGDVRLGDAPGRRYEHRTDT